MTNQTRRTVLKTIGATGAALALPAQLFAGRRASGKPIRLGVIADLHGGLAVGAESRLDVFLAGMAKKNCDALIQLGDFAFPNEKHQSYADKFNGGTTEGDARPIFACLENLAVNRKAFRFVVEYT